MSYEADVDSVLKGTESNEARAGTSLSHTDHEDNDKAIRATTHHVKAQDNRSLRWRERDQTIGGGGGIQRQKNEGRQGGNVTPSGNN